MMINQKDKNDLEYWLGSDSWLIVSFGSRFSELREDVAQQIYETSLTNIGTYKIREYWTDYVKNKNFPVEDTRWAKIMWASVCYLLVLRYNALHLSSLVRRVLFAPLDKSISVEEPDNSYFEA